MKFHFLSIAILMALLAAVPASGYAAAPGGIPAKELYTYALKVQKEFPDLKTLYRGAAKKGCSRKDPALTYLVKALNLIDRIVATKGKFDDKKALALSNQLSLLQRKYEAALKRSKCKPGAATKECTVEYGKWPPYIRWAVTARCSVDCGCAV